MLSLFSAFFLGAGLCFGLALEAFLFLPFLFFFFFFLLFFSALGPSATSEASVDSSADESLLPSSAWNSFSISSRSSFSSTSSHKQRNCCMSCRALLDGWGVSWSKGTCTADHGLNSVSCSGLPVLALRVVANFFFLKFCIIQLCVTDVCRHTLPKALAHLCKRHPLSSPTVFGGVLLLQGD